MRPNLFVCVSLCLLAHQLGDGGWEETGGMGANAFATGQALYALRAAGQSVASAPFQKRVMGWRASQRPYPAGRPAAPLMALPKPCGAMGPCRTPTTRAGLGGK